MGRMRIAGALGLVAGAALLVAVRIDELKRWYISQWGTPHGLSGWVFAPITAVGWDQVYRPIAVLARISPDDAVLDVACGRGGFLDRHAKDAKRVVGLDHSARQLAAARRRLAGRVADGSAEFVQGDAHDLPWEDGTFDVVTCMQGLEHLDDPEAALAEMFRVLRPGGRLVVSYWINEDVEECAAECDFWGLDDRPSEAEVRKQVEGVGFAAVEVSYPARLDYHARLVSGVKPE